MQGAKEGGQVCCGPEVGRPLCRAGLSPYLSCKERCRQHPCGHLQGEQ